jgi:DnaJ family protein C protein 3
LTKIHHPDKATARGITKEQAEKKMAQINEAYEVLSDPELKAKFDRGEDPNDPMAQQGGHPFQGSPFSGGQQFFFQQGGFPGGGGQQFKFHAGGGGGNPFGGFPFGG